MLNTKLTAPSHAGDAWEWAIKNGRLFRVYTPKGKPFFDVLLLGQADYVAININDKGLYDPKGLLRLYSVNGEFRMWVEEGLKGPIRGVRWAIEFSTYEDKHHKPRYRIDGDGLATLAIEQIMGEIVNERGEIIGVK